MSLCLPLTRILSRSWRGVRAFLVPEEQALNCSSGVGEHNVVSCWGRRELGTRVPCVSKYSGKNCDFPRSIDHSSGRPFSVAPQDGDGGGETLRIRNSNARDSAARHLRLARALLERGCDERRSSHLAKPRRRAVGDLFLPHPCSSRCILRRPRPSPSAPFSRTPRHARVSRARVGRGDGAVHVFGGFSTITAPHLYGQLARPRRSNRQLSFALTHDRNPENRGPRYRPSASGPRSECGFTAALAAGAPGLAAGGELAAICPGHLGSVGSRPLILEASTLVARQRLSMVTRSCEYSGRSPGRTSACRTATCPGRWRR